MEPCSICLDTNPRPSQYTFTCECRAWIHQKCCERWKATSNTNCIICRNPTEIKNVEMPPNYWEMEISLPTTKTKETYDTRVSARRLEVNNSVRARSAPETPVDWLTPPPPRKTCWKRCGFLTLGALIMGGILLAVLMIL